MCRWSKWKDASIGGRILVTGTSGKLGQAVVGELVAHGNLSGSWRPAKAVYVVSDSRRPSTSSSTQE